ncbi:hypothetical protein [Natranaerofaba carboxydovora]|uniref:hypothetical protein n=1 Tax=Natranaerofaba carboxydovora TaxID=2742683 RepID=UPI001F12B11D|nr:hypothetical protein [Natranaerofaba carboxydovora]UMZ74956.1 hypothetical protein ACONDI_02562 [Natranaerofaba carboxydovora]
MKTLSLVSVNNFLSKEKDRLEKGEHNLDEVKLELKKAQQELRNLIEGSNQ